MKSKTVIAKLVLSGAALSLMLVLNYLSLESQRTVSGQEYLYKDSLQKNELMARAHSLFRRAEGFGAAYQIDSALHSFRLALQDYRELQDWENVARMYNRMGFHLHNVNTGPELAMESADSALAIAGRHLADNDGQIAYAHMTKGKLFTDRRELDSAVYYFKRSISESLLFDESKARAALFMINENYSQLAACYLGFGLAEEALAASNASLPYAEKFAGPEGYEVARVLQTMAGSYQWLGEFQRALELQERSTAIKIRHRGEESSSAALAYYALGTAHKSAGSLQSARRYFERSIAIYEKIGLGDTRALINCYRDLGEVALAQDDFDVGFEALERSNELCRPILTPRFADYKIAYGLFSMALAKLRQDQKKEALQLVDSSLALLAVSQNLQGPDVAKAYSVKARILGAGGDVGTALQILDSAFLAVAIDPLNGDAAAINEQTVRQPDIPFVILQSKSEILIEANNRSHDKSAFLIEALQAHEQYVEVIDARRSDYRFESSKLILSEDKLPVWESAIGLALRLWDASGDPDYFARAFSLAEKSKSFNFLRDIVHTRAASFGRLPDSLKQRERLLRSTLRSLEVGDAAADNSESADAAGSSAESLPELLHMRSEYEELLRKLEREYPDYYRLKYNVNVATPDDVRSALLSDTDILVEYFLGADKLCIFVVGADTLHAEQLDIDSSLLMSVTALRHALVDRDFDRYVENAHELYDVLIAPIAALVKGRNVTIVPDGVLGLLPFEALLTRPVAAAEARDYSALSYLIRDLQITYAYSATLLLDAEGRQGGPGRPQEGLGGFAPAFASKDE